MNITSTCKQFKFFLPIVALMLLLTSGLVLPARSYAEHDGKMTFQVSSTLSDGKNGRVWKQWRQKLPEKLVRKVEVELQKQSGGNDTFVNLRFGSDSTLENGKRVTLSNNAPFKATWIVNQMPKGRELVLNAYKGEVSVKRVTVLFATDKVRDWKIRRAPRPYPKGYIEPKRPHQGPNDDHHSEGFSSGSDKEDAARECETTGHLRRPRIEIGRIKSSGGLFSNKYKVEGEIFGKCIDEAGYYERTQLKESIKIPLNKRYRRYQFNIKVKTGKGGKIRVFTYDGRKVSVDIDEMIEDYQKSSPSLF